MVHEVIISHFQIIKPNKESKEMKRIFVITLAMTGIVFAGFQKMNPENVRGNISVEYVSVISGIDSEILFTQN